MTTDYKEATLLANALAFADAVNAALRDYSEDADESGKAERRFVDRVRKSADRYRQEET